MPARWLVIGLLLGLSACSNLPVGDFRGADELPEGVELSSVPFHAQEDDQCGPASLAELLTYAGKVRSPDELRSEVFLPQRRGSLQAELLAATRRSGLLPYVLEPAPQALLSELAGGNPVLVLQNLGIPGFDRWHYAVAIGYDRKAENIILRSGRQSRLVMDFADFDRSWAKSGRWAFVAMAPERLPESASESSYVAAAVALEAISPEIASRAYGAALQRWPGNLVARLGQGNAAYRRHDLAAAEAAYRKATVDHPGEAIAWNNLAQTLHEQGFNSEALQAIRRAIAIGGEWQETYARTLSAIEGRENLER